MCLRPCFGARMPGRVNGEGQHIGRERGEVASPTVHALMILMQQQQQQRLSFLILESQVWS